VGEEALRTLMKRYRPDGCAVKPGDILVGKNHAEGETQLSSEESFYEPFLVKRPAMSETPLSAFLPVLKGPH